MSLLKSGYKVFRSIIMTVIMLLVAVYVGVYVVLSVPAVQTMIREKISEETSRLVGGRIVIERLTVMPYSEVLLSGVSLDSPDGERCAEIDKVAAGIDLWKLLNSRKIVFNYAEIIGMNVKIAQAKEHGPLNIQFLIEALSPKDRVKPSALFDLRIRNIVVRDSRVIFSRPWMTKEQGRNTDFSEITIDGLRMDLSIPTLRNDLFRFDVRNIQFEASPGCFVKNLSAIVSYIKDNTHDGTDRIMVEDLNIMLPHSRLAVGNMDIPVNSMDELSMKIEGYLNPTDFSQIWKPFEAFDSKWNIVMDSSLKGKRIRIGQILLEEPNSGSYIRLMGGMEDYTKKDSIDFTLEELKAELSSHLISETVSLIPQLSKRGREILYSLGKVELDLQGKLEEGSNIELEGFIATQIGGLDFTVSGSDLNSKRPKLKLSSELEDVDFGRLLAIEIIGKVSASLEADLCGKTSNIEGTVKLNSDEFELMGNILSDVVLDLEKSNDGIDLSLTAESDGMEVNIDGSAILAGKGTRIDAEMDLAGFNPSNFGVKGKLADCDVSVSLKAHTVGDNLDNLIGEIELRDLNCVRPGGRSINLSALKVDIEPIEASADQTISGDRNGDGLAETCNRDIQIDCDWLTARMTGYIKPSTLGKEVEGMVASVFPVLMKGGNMLQAEVVASNDFTFDINIKGASAPYVFFDTPLRPLIDIPIKGSIDAEHGKAYVILNTPHLQQGKNKLLRDLHLSFDIDSFLGMAKMNAGLIIPVKKGEGELVADVFAVRDNINVNLGINPTMESVVKGGVSLGASFFRVPDSDRSTGELAVSIDILPSVVTVNDKAWTIAKGDLEYSGKRISVSNFLIKHEDQYIKIDGTASEDMEEHLKVKLNDIDLEYIFNLLNINYVSFGGMATGEVIGNRLLSNTPFARTESLHVRGLSYNGAVLGDGDLASDYDASEKKVGIFGVIRDPLTRERRASIDGGIWVTRDSLSFGFDANRLNVGIMKPFVSAFCSDIYGEASGKCKLFGTFTDIDLIGDLKADTLSMKLDFTNTWYHAGNDSVFLSKGQIEIPPLTLYDDERHTAELSGWLKHRYFHDPEFSFRLRDARSLLCYNTNERINPLWYGTIYGSGHAQIYGRPGLIDIDMNMTTEEGSKFNYIISDAEDVEQSSFLTFTDRRKESLKAAETDSVPEYLKKFHKKNQEMKSVSSNVILSLKGTVTNDAFVTLVMDPRAGDNITARGQGALQMDYNMASNDLRMIGTYVLDEGNYNFTLQDIIIKNFSIKKGSLIKFDGDPMKANLDIAATYRVNTNLTDLDKSFSTDKELNRTNVPVDAVLLVDGPMTNPDITFDIELPSLTSDVERKVKSIVSTNDMMSRQIIYLLALNRFYTPEYTGGQSNGSEWSSMASSTISSQLSNILSQMTDKLNVAPSFRSEKGDFSDMEFDLALSSRLLNNRLLINGNFGYRDRSTSNTQFVGDFDIEYLLSKNGNIRLKAYNHFNDQSYYLRSALTTQGVGVVFRRDFDRLFRKKKNERWNSEEKSADSIVGAEGKEIDLNMSTDSLRIDK